MRLPGARQRNHSQAPDVSHKRDTTEKAPLRSPIDLPETLIAARAYEKWVRRGRPMGQDAAQDWFAARADLEQERLGWAAPQPSDRERGVSE